MPKFKSIVVATIVTASVTGCATPAPPPAISLIEYVEGRGYIPLKIPREKWGPGTAITLDNEGNENIVIFNDQCVKLRSPSDFAGDGTDDVRATPAKLETVSYKNDRSLKADIRLDEAAVPDLSLESAFSDARVKEVEVKIGSAKQYVASDLTLLNRTRSLIEAQDPCLELLLASKVYVIDDVLAVGGSSFSFKGSNDTNIKLDAGLLSLIGASTEFANKWNGSSSLTVEEPSIIGYKIYRYDLELGAGSSSLKVERVSPEAFEAQRVRARR